MKRFKRFSRLQVFTFLFGLTLSATALENVAVPKPNPNLDLARQLNQAFVQVAEEVSPSVVVITVTQKSSDSPFKVSPGQEPMMAKIHWIGFHRSSGNISANLPRKNPLVRDRASSSAKMVLS